MEAHMAETQVQVMVGDTERMPDAIDEFERSRSPHGRSESVALAAVATLGVVQQSSSSAAVAEPVMDADSIDSQQSAQRLQTQACMQQLESTGSTLTLEITRDNQSGGGFFVAHLSSPTAEQSIGSCQIGGVVPGGPASCAGLGSEHVGWHISHVDGREVTQQTCQAALDATKSPGQSFTLSIRKPESGEVIVQSTNQGNGSMTTRMFIEPGDIKVGFTPAAGGGAHLNVAIARSLAATIERTTPGGLAAFRQVLRDRIEQMGTVRERFTPSQRRHIELEERLAARGDVPADDEAWSCVVCQDSKRAVVLCPCHHIVTCNRCTVMARRMGCHICRAPVESVRSVDNVQPGEVVYLP